MFFAHKIKSIRPTDRVLEVGPGNSPYCRSDILLERKFDEIEALEQRGRTSNLKTTKPVVFYDGGRFPFEDGAFDYVICSHVLEHVDDIEQFCSELFRVAPKGYVEFPTVHYEYLYNFSVHKQLLNFSDKGLIYLPKADSGLAAFQPLQNHYNRSLELGYSDLVQDLKPLMFQGIEWNQSFEIIKASSIADLVPSSCNLQAPRLHSLLIRKILRWFQII